MHDAAAGQRAVRSDLGPGHVAAVAPQDGEGMELARALVGRRVRPGRSGRARRTAAGAASVATQCSAGRGPRRPPLRTLLLSPIPRPPNRQLQVRAPDHAPDNQALGPHRHRRLVARGPGLLGHPGEDLRTGLRANNFISFFSFGRAWRGVWRGRRGGGARRGAALLGLRRCGAALLPVASPGGLANGPAAAQARSAGRRRSGQRRWRVAAALAGGSGVRAAEAERAAAQAVPRRAHLAEHQVDVALVRDHDEGVVLRQRYRRQAGAKQRGERRRRACRSHSRLTGRDPRFPLQLQARPPAAVQGG